MNTLRRPSVFGIVVLVLAACVVFSVASCVRNDIAEAQVREEKRQEHLESLQVYDLATSIQNKGGENVHIHDGSDDGDPAMISWTVSQTGMTVTVDLRNAAVYGKEPGWFLGLGGRTFANYRQGVSYSGKSYRVYSDSDKAYEVYQAAIDEAENAAMRLNNGTYSWEN